MSVYFIQHGARGAIKIGHAKDIKKRLQGLNTPDTLAVLAVLPGGRELERRLHRALGKYQRRLEWFNPYPEVMAVVSMAKAKGIDAIERWLDTVETSQALRVPPAYTDDLNDDIRTLFAFAMAEMVRLHGMTVVAEASGKALATVEGYRRQKADPGVTALIGLIALDPDVFAPLFARINMRLIAAGEAIDGKRGQAA